MTKNNGRVYIFEKSPGKFLRRWSSSHWRKVIIRKIYPLEKERSTLKDKKG